MQGINELMKVQIFTDRECKNCMNYESKTILIT